MPTELVLLSNTIPTSELVASLGGERHPGGALVEYRGGQVRQWITAEGEGVLSLFTSRPIEVTREADAALGAASEGDGGQAGTGGYRLWTSLAIPYGDPTTGRVLAQAIADAVGGQVRDYM